MIRRSLFLPVLFVLFTLTSVKLYAQPLTVGESYNGRLTTSDSTLDPGQYVNCIELNLPTDRDVIVTLRSHDFDAVLMAGSGTCTGDDINLYLFNDDFENSSTDAQLVFTPSARQYLAAITSYSPGQTGAYTLSVEYTGTEVSGKDTSTSISSAILNIGQTHSGTLRSSDLTLDSGENAGLHYQCFDLNVTSGQETILTLRSRDFDAYLIVGTGRCDGDFHLDMENDDFEDGSRDAQLRFTPTQTQYIAVVTTYSPGETGNFTLNLANSGGSTTSGFMTLTFDGALTLLSDNFEGHYFECHSIPTGAGTDLTVNVHAQNYDPMLIISNGPCDNPGDPLYVEEGQAGHASVSFTSNHNQHVFVVTTTEPGKRGSYVMTVGF